MPESGCLGNAGSFLSLDLATSWGRGARNIQGAVNRGKLKSGVPRMGQTANGKPKPNPAAALRVSARDSTWSLRPYWKATLESPELSYSKIRDLAVFRRSMLEIHEGQFPPGEMTCCCWASFLVPKDGWPRRASLSSERYGFAFVCAPAIQRYVGGSNPWLGG